MNYLSQNWPLFLLFLWFGYKWWNSRRIQNMLPTLRAQGAIFIDVRSTGEYGARHAPGTRNIPLQELSSRIHELSPTEPIVVCCASGTRSGMAGLLLKQKGFQKVYNIGQWTKLL